ncbi:MAG: class I SAM-dependent methyltransferase, partial [Bacteroidia bacterium]|nr:class I SAM-dependent methyltransferase [Bacteroidia bacterium]
DNPWWGEHVHRYEVALSYLSPGSSVLDIACGSGFGSYLLAKNGHTVNGADLSEETILQCNQEFQHPQLKYTKADATKLPFPDEHYDAVVSFETIEHTRQYLEVLQEFKRVVKKNGIILISTPNILVNSPDGVVRNPYHTQEWNYRELNDLLLATYPSVKIYGQSYSRYNGKSGIKNKLAKLTENTLYLRGIRKLPLGIQNGLMQSLINKPMYPLASDYSMVSEQKEIEACKTFFAVCRLK